MGSGKSTVAELLGKKLERTAILEIEEKSNMHFLHIANSDKPVAMYSLDVILSVGYRTNSIIAIEFRKWATKTLRERITKGYTLNKKQIAKNYDAFMKSVGDIQALLPEHVAIVN